MSLSTPPKAVGDPASVQTEQTGFVFAAAAGARLAGVFFQLAITIGILLAYVIDYGFSGSGGWRSMLGLAVIPGAALSWGMIRMPESPRWLAKHNEADQARKVLARIRGGRNIEPEWQDIQNTLAETEERADSPICLLPSEPVRRALFLNHPAGDPVSRIPRGIGLVIIRAGVNYERRPTLVKQRIRSFAQSDHIVGESRLPFPACAHCEVQQVAGMRPFGVILAVLLHRGIEVPACRRKIRPLAHPDIVDVNRVHPRRQIHVHQADLYALSRWRNSRRAHRIALPVHQIRVRFLDRLCEYRNRNQCCGCAYQQ
jgi:hypothetical protein